MPEYHTLAQVEEFKKYITSIIKVESNSKSSYIEVAKPLTINRQKEIRRWIENEQVLCGLDCNYFETRYAWVCDEKGNIYKFQPRLSQRIYTSVVADFDERQVSIELLVLKGRQLGITTQTALKFLHRMLFIPHTQAIMASVKAEASQLISRIIDTAYNNSPWWLVPRRMPKRAFDNGSILSVQSGMQATGLAQGWTPSCLTPDSLIRVANGFVKPISQVTTDDSVITHTGKMVKVKAAFKTKRNPDVARSIKLWGHHSRLKCTPEHLIDTPDGWVEAAEISIGDFVRHPIRKITNEIASFETYRYPRGKIREDKRQYFSVNFSQELGYICGFYLAEGTCHGTNTDKKQYLSEVAFNIHKNEIKDREMRLRSYFGDSVNIKVKPKNTGNGATITVGCAWFARWIAENFGKTNKKTIPDWAWHTDKKFCLGIVNGYLDGDGSTCEDRNVVVAPSICQQLILQMRDMVASLGFGWSSIYFNEGARQKHDNSVRKDVWRIALTGPTAYNYRTMFGHFTQPLKNGYARHWKYGDYGESIDIMVESVFNETAEEFWDIEVDDEDHSFLTDQCSVHNCVHLSELADIPDPEKTIEEGLFRAAHSSKNLFMVLEGTGGGNTGWLADTWRSAKKDFPKSRLCPIFIPWPMCPEIYPQQDWIRKFPIENSWQPHEITRKHVMRAEAYIRNTPYLAKIAGADYRMPIEQQWFWQFNYDSACQNHTQKTWAAQMPCVTGDTLVSTDKGIMPICEAINVVRCESGEVLAMMPRGEKPIFKMTTQDGRILKGTKEHLVHLMSGEWKALGELCIGDKIALSPPMFAEQEYVHKWNDTPMYSSERIIDKKFGRLLGYFMGDGSYNSDDFTVACDAKDTDTIDDVANLIEEITGKETVRQVVGKMVRVRCSYVHWLPILRSIGAIGQVYHSDGHKDGWRRKVRVPQCIFRSPRHVIKEFLSALYECDGHANKRIPHITLYSAYDEFLRDIQQLLLGFGIKAEFQKQRLIAGATVKGGKKHEYTGRRLLIRSAWANQFYEQIGFAGSRKHTSGKRRSSEKYGDSTLFDTVVSVEDTGTTDRVFDLSVANTHRFGANGIDVHNCDDFEALTGEHDSVFDSEVIGEIENRIYEVIGTKQVRRVPVETYAITGHDIDDDFYPTEDQINWDKPTIRVKHHSHRGQSYEWTMVPLKAMDEDVESNTMDRVIIYEHPKPGAIYAFGIDTADGLGKEDEDRTVISGTRSRYNGESDYQVFELTSNKINSAQVVAFAACLGAYYGENSPNGKGVRFVIEQIGRPGETCQHQLKMMGFFNHHKPKRYDSKKINDNKTNKEGWWSSSWSVPILMTSFVEAVNGGWYEPKSKWLIEELKTLERHVTSGKSKMEHRSGQHDDRVRAAAQSYFSMHDMDILTERAQKRYSQPNKRKKSEGVCRAGTISVGDWE